MSGDAMTEFITAAGSVLTGASLWGNVTDALPLIGTVVGFALGFGIVKKIFKGASKGKVRM